VRSGGQKERGLGGDEFLPALAFGTSAKNLQIQFDKIPKIAYTKL